MPEISYSSELARSQSPRTDHQDGLFESFKTRDNGEFKPVIVYRSIESLKPNPRNPRTHTKKQIRKLTRSLEKFGWINPVIIDSFGMIIAGHGRIEAARLLGLKEIPCICLDHLAPVEIQAYMLADNRLAEDAGWDRELLKIELLELSYHPDFDISLTGFEIPEIDLILDTSSTDENDPIDRVEPLAPVAVTQPGDLWLLGDHKIYCGNAQNADSYSILLGGRQASVVYTDPPFNVPIDGHAGGNGQFHHRDFAMASGEMTIEQFTEFLLCCLGHLAQFSKDGAVHFVAMDWRHLGELLEAGKQVYSSMLNLCVWNKNNGGMGSFYRSKHELILVFKVGRAPHRNNIQLGKFGRYRTNVWDYPGANTLSRSSDEGNVLAMHPTVKPIALVADALLDCSARGEIVLDAFLGSGSTLLAAERTRRICYGMEIDPLYVDLAIRRWQQLTGERAYHAVTGIPFGSQTDQEVSHG